MQSLCITYVSECLLMLHIHTMEFVFYQLLYHCTYVYCGCHLYNSQ